MDGYSPERSASGEDILGSRHALPHPDWLADLNSRLRSQEEELTLVKSALADALRRLSFYDRQIPLLLEGSPSNIPEARDPAALPQRGDAFWFLPSVRPGDSSPSAIQRPRGGDETVPCGEKGRQGVATVSVGTQTKESTILAEKESRRVPNGHLQRDLESSSIIGEPDRGPSGIASTNHPEVCASEDQNSSGSQVEGESQSLASETQNVLDGSRMPDLGCCLPRTYPHEAQDVGEPPPEDEADEAGSTAPSQASRQPLPAQDAPSPEPVSEGGSSNSSSTAASPVPSRQNLMASKKELLRRNSSSDKLPRTKKQLSRKAASSANLLNRSGSLENRIKDPVLSSGPQSSRRGNYNLEGLSIKMFLRGRPITMYIPSDFPNYEDLRMELPAEKLQLDWVYGYRGRDCRSNLYVLHSGELVYFIACVVVLYHVQRRTQRHYLRHTDCVRCLAVHPDRVRVASGQMAGVDKDGKPLQPFVDIWDSTTLLPLQQIGLGSFERGVGSLAFSTADGGAYLCVVDESNEHMLSVWECARGSKLAEIKSTNESVLTVDFNPLDSSCIISTGKSHIYFWSWSGSSLTKKQGIFGKYKKPKFIHCFVFNNTDSEVLTGDSEGNILIWSRVAADVRTLGKAAKETYQISKQTRAHEGSLFSLCLCRDGSVLSGGGKDRRLVRWSPDLALLQEAEIPEQFGAVRTIAEGDGGELLVGTTRNALLRGTLAGGFKPIIQGHTDELWGLGTHPSRTLFATCGYDRQLCMWDGGAHALAWSIALEETGLCADFHPTGNVVAVGLATGGWVVLDTEGRHVFSCPGGSEQLSVVRYSPDGNFLAIGSHDNFIYIYSVEEAGRRYSRLGRCTGHSSFITHLDWSKDGKFIMSNSGDYEILYWDVANGCKLLRNRFENRDREWASYTCVLGFHVFGVWPDGSDGTDINALCRSHNERVVAVADDFCKVHLFQYPCAKPKAPSHVYGGHGSHVTNVGFTHDDSHLISMGGKDTSILQWRVVGLPAAST